MSVWQTPLLKLNYTNIYKMKKKTKINNHNSNKKVAIFKRNEIKDKVLAKVRPKGLPDFMKANISITFDLKTRVMISGLSSCL
jgi:hypothetical protein